MTSVEWFAKRVYEEMNMSGDGRILDMLLEQALMIHKHEIIQTYKNALQSPYHSDHCWTPQGETTKSEQYYKETFKKD